LHPALRVTEREFSFFRLTWKGTSFSAFAAPVLLLLALGVGLGSFVEERPSLDGLTYLQFLAPGLLVAAAVQLVAGLGLWPIMAGHRWIGFHRAMIASPIGAQDVAAGYLLWMFLRATMQAVVFVAVAALFGGIVSPWGVVAPLIAGLTAAAFGAPLMAYTATCDSDRAFDPIMRIVVTPLYLFSGSFFPTSQLPAPLEAVAMVFPLWHGIELARFATTGIAPALNPFAHLTVILVWIAVGAYAARRTFVRRLAP
jgi:lipooligosaccharide transport system permease protein